MSLPYHKPPPHERPNWERMNEGQKRYAMEQYNLALVRRGAKFTPPTDESEDEDFDIDQFVNNEYDALGVQHEGTSQDREVDEESLPNTQENEAADNFLNTLRDKQMDTSPPAGSVNVAKRPISSKGGAGGKKSKMNQPGTSSNTDEDIGGAIGGGGGDASTLGIQPISRGITNHKQTYTFTKRWKFLSFGIADQILNDTALSANRLALTTSLAAVPWEYGFFYMSPAEFTRMQEFRNVFAKHCSITVSQFNPRVAFETGGTETTTATLNQNKFTRWAIGIRGNAGLYCSDREYTYDTTETMKPTGFDATLPASNRASLADAMYGLVNSTAIATHNLNIPAYATGAELELEQYLTVYASKTGTHGFPPYDQYCHEVNSMDYLGRELFTQSYNFEYAPLQKRHPMVFNNGLTENLYPVTGTTNQVTTGTRFEGIFTKVLPTDMQKTPENDDNNNLKYTQESDNSTTNVDSSNYDNNRPYYRFPMEQNGTYLEMSRKVIDYAHQPSVHIGVRAVPKLTTAANQIQANSWLDTQIYFTIQASLTVEAHDSYFYVRGGPTIIPAQAQLVSCLATGDDPPVLQSRLQQGDRTYVCGRRSIVINTTND